MNSPALVAVVCVLAAAATSALVATVMPPKQAAQPLPADALESIQSQISKLESRLGEMQQKMDTTARSAEVAVAAPVAQRVDEKEIEAIVSRAFAKLASAAGPATAGNAVASVSSAKKIDVAGSVATLLKSDVSYEDKQKIYQQLREAGLIDKVVAMIEAKAAEEKGNAELQYQLGHTYLEKLQTVPDGPEKGEWAMKADAMFDRTLELNNTHWGARFTKAMSLSFWPPVFGKQQEAINQFEILLKQQEDLGGSRPEYANTYQLLGNLYSQQGNQAKAAATWQQGAKLFPGDAGLAKKAAGK